MRLVEQRDVYRDRCALGLYVARAFMRVLIGPGFTGFDTEMRGRDHHIDTTKVLSWLRLRFVPIIDGSMDNELHLHDERALIGAADMEVTSSVLMCREYVSSRTGTLADQSNLYCARCVELLVLANDFEEHLLSDKFRGIDARDGRTKAYINTNDVLSRLSECFVPVLRGDDDDQLTWSNDTGARRRRARVKITL